MKDETLNEFLKDIPDTDKDIFKESLIETPPEKGEEKPPEKEEDGYKNRRHRRLEAQLDKEREARIAAEARAQALSETRQFAQEVGTDDVSQKLATLYGTDDNGKRAAQITKELLESYRVQAKEDALKEVEGRQQKALQEQRQYESLIDSELESIEDEFNVDVTSDAPAARKARREFLEVVQALSPKDKDGAITGYADFSGAWEMYQLKRAKDKPSDTVNRQKDLADRSMTKSGSVDTSKEENDTQLQWLRKNGIQI